MVNSLDSSWFGQEERPLLELLNVEHNHISMDWFELFFGLCFDCQFCFSQETYDEAINLCKENAKLAKYQSLIEKNFDQLKQYL